MSYKYRVHRVKNARFPAGKPVYAISLTSSGNATLEDIKKRFRICVHLQEEILQVY